MRTDEWAGYTPLGSEYTLQRIKSDKGKNFSEMHTLIKNLKSWLRGIYHKCSEKHMQAYLNEFFYRFNRRAFGKTCFHNLLVPVCFSSTHMAFGSIRMEPVFMVLGQSAAAAANIAIDDKVSVQDVSYSKLKAVLLKRNTVLEYK